MDKVELRSSLIKALFPDSLLLALDGTEYFSSQTIHCASCLHKVHRNGSITYFHQMLGAAIIHPDQRAVIPLMPEPIVNRDGTDKNDCERNAAKRLLWERMRALFYTYALASMRQLFEALLYGLKKPTPVFGFDSA